jgi:hypothetical protein
VQDIIICSIYIVPKNIWYNCDASATCLNCKIFPITKPASHIPVNLLRSEYNNNNNKI